MAANHRDTERLEYFSDAVFAIAATLLASELPIPRAGDISRAHETLLEAMSRHWPSYVGFAASFLFIGIAWANHHAIFRYIRRTDHFLLILNLVFLMGIVLYGFVTQIVIEHLGKRDERAAVLLYYGLLSSTALLYNVVWWYVVKKQFLIEMDDGKVRALTWEYALSPLLHVVAFIVALWSVPWSLLPLVAVYVFFATARLGEKGDEDEAEGGPE